MHFASSILIVFFCFPFTVYGRVELNDFFSFGPTNGDSLLPYGDDNGESVTISRPFPFFNTSQSFIYVNTNGALSLKDVIQQYSPTCGGPSSSDYIMIAPYWSDVETSFSGTTAGVYYRESTDAAILLKATQEVQRAFPGDYPTLSLNWAFITTWSNVTFYNAIGCYNMSTDQAPRNTFQAIVTTDGVHSFVIFNYNKLTWSAGIASGSDCNGRGGFPAKAGLDSGEGKDFLLIGDSCSENVINLVDQTNVNQPGKWIFGTGEAHIQTPKPEVITTTEAPKEKCEAGWTYFAETQSCYTVIFNCSFNQCETICQSKASHLTSIHSQTENKFVNDLAATGQPQWNFNQTIIGFHQIGGRWVWTDNTAFSYHPWAPGQPDFNRQIQWCGLTYSDVATFPGKWGLNQYFWDDVECNIPARSAVCKKAAVN